MKKNEMKNLILLAIILVIIVIIVSSYQYGIFDYSSSSSQETGTFTIPENIETGTIQQEINTSTAPETTIKQTETPSEEQAFFIREYSGIEEMFLSTGKELKTAIEDMGYNVTNMERSNDVRRIISDGVNTTHVPSEDIKNYAFVAVDVNGITKQTMFDTSTKVAEDIVPYIKSYYTDADIWIVLVHDKCNRYFGEDQATTMCIYSIPELNLGGCNAIAPMQWECYGQQSL